MSKNQEEPNQTEQMQSEEEDIQYSSESQSESQFITVKDRQKFLQKRKRLSKMKKKKKIWNEGPWSLQENLKYMAFLKQNLALFSLSASRRRIIKINVQISKEVKSRSPDQCRSHHQKMMKYHKTATKIVEFIERFSPSQQPELPQSSSKEQLEMLIDPQGYAVGNFPTESGLLNLLYEQQRAESRGILDIFDEALWLDDEAHW